MEKEVYTLLDTAVKIGLGALISGFSAYFLAKNSFNQSQVADKRARTIQFLQDIATSIESARINHEKATHPYWYRASAGAKFEDATKESLDYLSKSMADIGKARAIASLLDLASITQSLKLADEILESLFQDVATFDATKIADDLNVQSSAFRSELDSALNELACCYKNA
ncbi:hypothetical protein [Vibrio europaeus]|uniref:hypothetical protein n=1 Tax=Vibrio europaeus TaxID=300876 RepID=UPI00233EB43D|nr:hypothetical protein [Vibrio europaeus]MDC5855726.1 hypothetical protein [Vibrio europaeus]